MKNAELVKTLFTLFEKMNVQDVVVCAGARNLPFVQRLESHEFKVQSYFEERSAAFYALGKSRASATPVVILTTSGTAVAELLPAVIEAHYQSVPLIVLSADRPKRYRGTGSPQAIEQAGLFTAYAEKSFDWDTDETRFNIALSLKGPVHFNVCFDEPLVESSLNYGEVRPHPSTHFSVGLESNLKLRSDEIEILRPFAILAEIPPNDRPAVTAFLLENKILHYPEFLSGLQGADRLRPLQVQNLEALKIWEHDQYTSLIRIGGIPTHRTWRDLEDKGRTVLVFSFSSRKFTGLARTSQLFSMKQLTRSRIINASEKLNRDILNLDQTINSRKLSLLKKFARGEQSFTAELSRLVNSEPLYIGNSLPIREWDLFTEVRQTDQPVFANRGANGIDGQISTYLGWSTQFTRSWCIVGDLTALYDLASLGLHQDDHQKRIMVINNGGGQIFDRVFGHKKFLNGQDIDFAGWAKLWKWKYVLVETVEGLRALERLGDKKVIVEIRPAATETDQFWREWDLVCRS